MSTEFSIDKHREKMKKASFKIFFFGVIEVILLNIYIIISSLTRYYNWTIERLTTTSEGIVIQLIGLIAIVSGIYIFIQVMAYIALFLTIPDDSN